MAKDSFLPELLQTIQNQNSRIESKLDRIESKQDLQSSEISNVKTKNRAHEKRLKEIEDSLKKVETEKGSKITIDNKLLTLISTGAVILLVIIAAVLKIPLPGL